MTTTDFVMPKLGLTMTEGTIARWDVAPGKSFAQGDIILVVETDKIAYDVEAPAPGVLQEVLVAAGSAVPVGTPIGRWDVGDIKVSLDAPDIAPAAAPTAAKAPAPAAPATPRRADGALILATPYARRLARQAGIDWRSLDGSGPRGRIKAADVERAIAQKKAAPASLAEAAPVVETAPTATFSAGVEIDVTALLALAEQVNTDLPDLHADLAHFVALAAAKASDAFPKPLILGLAAHTENGAGEASLLAGGDCRTLSGLVGQAKIPAATSTAASRGTLWIERAQHGISFFSAEPSAGWSAALAIGAVREAFRPDPEGRAVRAALVTIVLTARASALGPQQGQRLLGQIRHLLEAPLLLLAS
jgi:pyruvate dehydrogenase E2 component (dihydrolipoyllysine-residue acetyltransferase)